MPRLYLLQAHLPLRKAPFNNLSFNALRNIYISLEFISSGGELASTPFTVCKYTKFPNTTKHNTRKIVEMWRKMSNASEKNHSSPRRLPIAATSRPQAGAHPSISILHLHNTIQIITILTIVKHNLKQVSFTKFLMGIDFYRLNQLYIIWRLQMINITIQVICMVYL